jgi:hypothetical protein
MNRSVRAKFDRKAENPEFCWLATSGAGASGWQFLACRECVDGVGKAFGCGSALDVEMRSAEC